MSAAGLDRFTAYLYVGTHDSILVDTLATKIDWKLGGK
jgi:hypothetical protein